MDNRPGLFPSSTGEWDDSVSVHFPPDDFTLTSPMEDGAPYSATYTTLPVPVVWSSAIDARYDQLLTKPFSGCDAQPLISFPLLLSKKAAVMVPD